MRKKRVISGVRRRWTVRLYPSLKQTKALEATAALHCELYNAALQERRDAYRLHKKSISHTDQALSLKEVKMVRPEFCDVTQMAQNATLRRVELAFAAFFRRCKERKKAKKSAKLKDDDSAKNVGYPRFKSAKRYRGWDYPRHGNGCKLYPETVLVDDEPQWRNGKLYLQHIGKIKFRGRTSYVGQITTVTIRRHAGLWFASIVVESEPRRTAGEGVAGLDWGVETFATLAYGSGDYVQIANDRLFAQQQGSAKERQRAASSALKGKRSKRAQRKHLRIARAHTALANRRKDRAHKQSAKLIAKHAAIFTEELHIANMTASAKGALVVPGKNVRQKAGLNREILDTAPGMFFNMMRYKAEEAGCWIVFFDTRKYKPSQTCPGCAFVRKKPLSERQHVCDCGFAATRDQAAALNLLAAGQKLLGQELTSG